MAILISLYISILLCSETLQLLRPRNGIYSTLFSHPLNFRLALRLTFTNGMQTKECVPVPSLGLWTFLLFLLDPCSSHLSKSRLAIGWKVMGSRDKSPWTRPSWTNSPSYWIAVPGYMSKSSQQQQKHPTEPSPTCQPTESWTTSTVTILNL